MSIFRKCHMKLFTIVKIGDPCWLWLHFYSVFWIFTQIGFASFGNLMSSFGEVYDPFCTVFLGASFIYFSKFSKFGTRFQDFSDPRPKKIGFGAWGHFCMFFRSNMLPVCLQYWQFSINSLRCSTKVFRMNLPVDMVLAPF